jgi:hypothetical protein
MKMGKKKKGGKEIRQVVNPTFIVSKPNKK